MSGLRKNKPKTLLRAGAPETNALSQKEKYSGQISRQLAIEMLQHAIRRIENSPPPASWPDSQKHIWYASIASTVETLIQRRDSLRLNVRTVILPKRYPADPGTPSRQYEYSSSLENAFEVIDEILYTAEQEAGSEFRKSLERVILRRYTRREGRMAKEAARDAANEPEKDKKTTTSGRK